MRAGSYDSRIVRYVQYHLLLLVYEYSLHIYEHDTKINHHLTCLTTKSKVASDDCFGSNETFTTMVASTTMTKTENSIAFRISQYILFSAFLLDLFLCPHSKVEESFQLQATYDLIYHGISPSLAVFQSDDFSTKNLPYDRTWHDGCTLHRFSKSIDLFN